MNSSLFIEKTSPNPQLLHLLYYYGTCHLSIIVLCVCCQALSTSQSLNLPLSLRDRDRADTIITLYHTTPPPPPETF